MQTGDLGCDPHRLLLRVVGGIADDRLALAHGGPQLLRLASLVVGDHRVRGVEDGLCGAVVLFEQNGLRVGEILFEVLDVADVRATERVDGLVGIAHHGDPGGPLTPGRHRRGRRRLPRIHARKLADQHILRMIGVLVFVDQNVTELVPVILGHVGVVAQQLHGAYDQIVEIDGVRHGETMLVFGIDDGIQFLDVIEIGDSVPSASRLEIRGIGGKLRSPADELVLVVGDAAEDGTRRVALDIHVEFGGDDLDQTFGVGGIVDGESGLQTEGLAVAAQDAHAGGVERGHPHALCDRADQRGKTLAHLGGRLIGEGDGEDLARPCAELAQDPCDPARQHPGLARSRACADEQRGAAVLHRFGLLLVQIAHEFVGGTRDQFRFLFHC